MSLIVENYSPILDKLKSYAIGNMNFSGNKEIILGKGDIVFKDNGSFTNKEGEVLEVGDILDIYQENHYNLKGHDSSKYTSLSQHSAIRRAIYDFRDSIKKTIQE